MVSPTRKTSSRAASLNARKAITEIYTIIGHGTTRTTRVKRRATPSRTDVRDTKREKIEENEESVEKKRQSETPEGEGKDGDDEKETTEREEMHEEEHGESTENERRENTDTSELNGDRSLNLSTYLEFGMLDIDKIGENEKTEGKRLIKRGKKTLGGYLPIF